MLDVPGLSPLVLDAVKTLIWNRQNQNRRYVEFSSGELAPLGVTDLSIISLLAKAPDGPIEIDQSYALARELMSRLKKEKTNKDLIWAYGNVLESMIGSGESPRFGVIDSPRILFLELRFGVSTDPQFVGSPRFLEIEEKCQGVDHMQAYCVACRVFFRKDVPPDRLRPAMRTHMANPVMGNEFSVWRHVTRRMFLRVSE